MATPKKASKGAASQPAAKPKTVKKNWFSEMDQWKKAVLVLAGLLLVTVAAFVLVINLVTNSSVKISNAFLDDVQANRADAAYALMSSEAQGTITQVDFRKVIARVSPILNTKETMKSKEVTGQTGGTTTAKVVYEIKGTDGVTYTFTNNLVKVGDEWKILNFTSARK